MSFDFDIAAALDAEMKGEKSRPGERREERRLPLRLKVAVVYHQHEDAATRPTFHGVTNDISLHGVSVVVERNFFNEEEVTVLLAVPPEHPGGTQKIIEATARMVYTVFSSEHDAFRVGMTFRAFKRNGKELLKGAMARCSFAGTA